MDCMKLRIWRSSRVTAGKSTASSARNCRVGGWCCGCKSGGRHAGSIFVRRWSRGGGRQLGIFIKEVDIAWRTQRQTPRPSWRGALAEHSVECVDRL
eukprot:jgi/Tetstr1/460204/TSEL_005519.t1